METLPSDIIRLFLSALRTDAINLALTCKKLYSIYIEKRNRNKQIAARFERVNKKRNECIRDKSFGVVFDRMYLYGEQIMFVVKTFCHRRRIGDIDVDMRYTYNKWKRAHCR